MMAGAVFLDRDGVLNRALVRNGKPYPPPSLEELEFLPGVREAIDELRRAGFRLIIVTNQPDVTTGKQRREVVESMHEMISRELRVDEIKVCYHIDRDDCACRKPRAGMLFEAARDWDIDLASSFMVGDRWRDIEAGRAAGCKTILIKYDYDERQAEGADAIVDSLAEASELILSGKI